MSNLNFAVSAENQGSVSILSERMANNSFHFKVEAEVPSTEAAQYFQNVVQATSSYFQGEQDTDESKEEKQYTLDDWQYQLRCNLRRTDLPHITLDPYGSKHRQERGIVRSAMDGGGAFTVRSQTGERRYTIVFMEEAPPLMQSNGTLVENVPNLPFCSCRAYRYRSYDSGNQRGWKGGCKHLHEVFDYAEREDFGNVNWNFRPEDPNADPWVVISR